MKKNLRLAMLGTVGLAIVGQLYAGCFVPCPKICGTPRTLSTTFSSGPIYCLAPAGSYTDVGGACSGALGNSDTVAAAPVPCHQSCGATNPMYPASTITINYDSGSYSVYSATGGPCTGTANCKTSKGTKSCI